MKLAHPDSDTTVETNEPEAYLSQGWIDTAEIPAGNASLEAWQDFARDRGLTDDEIEGKSRDDLRDSLS